MGQQQPVNEAAVEAVRDFLGGPWPDGDGWTFQLGDHLSSNWGAVYGGATAAATVALSRLAAADRSPRSMHVQMLRPLPPGATHATAEVRHSGRTVATVATELFDSGGRLASVGLVTCVRPDALARTYRGTRADVFELAHQPVDLADGQAPTAPIATALRMPAPADEVGNTITNLPPSVTGGPARCSTIAPPWADTTTTGPELACLIADAMNGTPIVASLDQLGPVSWPNTDLTLRFTNAPGDDPVIASGTLVAVDDGTTTVLITVQAGGQWLAHGHSTSVLLPVPHDGGGQSATGART